MRPAVVVGEYKSESCLTEVKAAVEVAGTPRQVSIREVDVSDMHATVVIKLV